MNRELIFDVERKTFIPGNINDKVAVAMTRFMNDAPPITNLDLLARLFRQTFDEIPNIVIRHAHTKEDVLKHARPQTQETKTMSRYAKKQLLKDIRRDIRKKEQA